MVAIDVDVPFLVILIWRGICFGKNGEGAKLQGKNAFQLYKY